MTTPATSGRERSNPEEEQKRIQRCRKYYFTQILFRPSILLVFFPAFRTLSELFRRLDDGVAKCRLLSDLFSVDLCFLRVRCRDYAVKLWNVAPTKYGMQVD